MTSAPIDQRIAERLKAIGRACPTCSGRSGKYCSACNSAEAQIIFQETRALNLPRATLHGEKHKAKTIAVSAHAKRNLLSFEVKRAELQALLAGGNVVPMKKSRAKKSAHVCANCGHVAA